MSFLSNENLEQVVTIFGEYMRDKYNVNIVSVDENISNLTLKTMRMVAANAAGNESVKELNIQVLGNLRKYYVGKLQQQVASARQPVRDTEVFGNRQVIFKETVPLDTGADKKIIDLGKRMEMLEARRASEFAKPVPPEIEPSVKEKAENMEDFILKVKELEKERDKTLSIDEKVNENIKSIEFLTGAPSIAAKKAAMGGGGHHNHGASPTITPIGSITTPAVMSPQQPLNVNRNLRLVRDALAALDAGGYFVKCLSVKYSGEDFEHIIMVRFSVDSVVYFKIADYSLVGDKATVMYEPIVPNDIVIVDPTVVIGGDGWLGYTLVLLKPPQL